MQPGLPLSGLQRTSRHPCHMTCMSQIRVVLVVIVIHVGLPDPDQGDQVIVDSDFRISFQYMYLRPIPEVSSFAYISAFVVSYGEESELDFKRLLVWPDDLPEEKLHTDTVHGRVPYHQRHASSQYRNAKIVPIKHLEAPASESSSSASASETASSSIVSTSRIPLEDPLRLFVELLLSLFLLPCLLFNVLLRPRQRLPWV
jgi:hypothetical protein